MMQPVHTSEASFALEDSVFILLASLGAKGRIPKPRDLAELADLVTVWDSCSWVSGYCCNSEIPSAFW